MEECLINLHLMMCFEKEKKGKDVSNRQAGYFVRMCMCVRPEMSRCFKDFQPFLPANVVGE